MTPETLIQTARDYIGTPFHFGGRLKGVGIDCGGLLVCAAGELGMKLEVDPAYTRQASFDALRNALDRHANQIKGARPSKGDILLFSARMMPGHCGLFTGEGTFIHAYDSPSVCAVVETELDEGWQDRIVRIYRPHFNG